MHSLPLNAENCSRCIIIGFNLLHIRWISTPPRAWGEGYESRKQEWIPMSWWSTLELCTALISSTALCRSYTLNARHTHTHSLRSLWKSCTWIFTSWRSTVQKFFMNEGVRTRREGGMNERGRIPTTHTLFQPSMSLTFKCVLCLDCSHRRCREAARLAEVRLSRRESRSWNPPGDTTQGICLRRLCVCAWVCVWPLTSDSVWPLCWQAPVKGVPVWAEHSQTTWESAWTTLYVCTANVILRIKGSVWAS